MEEVNGIRRKGQIKQPDMQDAYSSLNHLRLPPQYYSGTGDT